MSCPGTLLHRMGIIPQTSGLPPNKQCYSFPVNCVVYDMLAPTIKFILIKNINVGQGHNGSVCAADIKEDFTNIKCYKSCT